MARRKTLSSVIALVCVLATGCSTVSSYVHGKPRVQIANDDVVHLAIMSINGHFRLSASKVRVEPGRTEIVVSPIARRKSIPKEIAFVEDILPCKNYYYAGKFENKVSDRWIPLLVEVTDLPGCQLETSDF